MLVYHLTTAAWAREFLAHGIRADLPVKRTRFNAETEDKPGLFVAPTVEVALKAGTGGTVVSIEVEAEDLQVPPLLAKIGLSLEDCWSLPLEPQAMVVKRIKPDEVRLVVELP